MTSLDVPEFVTLIDLSVGGCRFALGERRLVPGTPLQIFIADTGPHRAVIKWVNKGEVGITFVRPLSEDLFNSFEASHIPDAANHNVPGDFDDLSDTLPQRFC